MKPTLSTKIANELSFINTIEWIDKVQVPKDLLRSCIVKTDWEPLLENIGYDEIDQIEMIQRHRDRLLSVLPSVKHVSDFGTREITEENEKYPFIFAEQSKKILDDFGNKYSLPVNAVINDTELYREIILPPGKTKNFSVPLIKLKDCSSFLQTLFKDIESFNEMQSIVFNCAYNSNENLLLSAPTSAGKTNVSLLTIARAIESTPKNELSSLKMVYVAPMKALVSEITGKFFSKLKAINMSVREISGDIQLSKQEMMHTNLLVSTPEKLDVITRKMHPTDSFMSNLKLLIIDEIHLLASERGSVLECLVARIQRFVESQQRVIRICGLSATLPNYFDVAEFIKCSPQGLFVFDNNWRPVPLHQHIIGVNFKQKDPKSRQAITKAAFEKLEPFIQDEKQVMVFVHSRNETLRVARLIYKMNPELFPIVEDYGYKQSLSKLKNKNFTDLLQNGIAIHHAGLLRPDRNKIENFFLLGHCRLLVCTATLAWGVNLPSSMVIIHGTSVYNPSISDYSNLSCLDVHQCFGRAGRPQFENSGTGILITTQDSYDHYVNELSLALPIESQFLTHLSDFLNAEIVLGTINTMQEAVSWLGFTYFMTRIRKNPFSYGVSFADIQKDLFLVEFRTKLLEKALDKLESREMIHRYFDSISSTQFGLIASHYYLSIESLKVYHEGLLKPHMEVEDVLKCICKSTEFDKLQSRVDELPILDKLLKRCPLEIQGTVSDGYGKANILLQSHINKFSITLFSLMSDQFYVIDNSKRLAKAIFDLCLHHKWIYSVESVLEVIHLLEPPLNKELPISVAMSVKTVKHDAITIKTTLKPTNTSSGYYYVCFYHGNRILNWFSCYCQNQTIEEFIWTQIPTPAPEHLDAIVLSESCKEPIYIELRLPPMPHDVVLYTNLLNLTPMPHNETFESFYDPITTQTYHELVNTQNNLHIATRMSLLKDLPILPNSLVITPFKSICSSLSNCTLKTPDEARLTVNHSYNSVYLLFAHLYSIDFFIYSYKCKVVVATVPLVNRLVFEPFKVYNFRPQLQLHSIEITSFVNNHKSHRLSNMTSYIANKVQPTTIVITKDFKDLKNTIYGLIQKQTSISSDLDMYTVHIKDSLLKHALECQLALFHSNLNKNDQSILFQLFELQLLPLIIVPLSDLFELPLLSFPKLNFISKEATDNLGLLQTISSLGHLNILCFDRNELYYSQINDPFILESLMDVQYDRLLCCHYKINFKSYLQHSFHSRRLLENPGYYTSTINDVITQIEQEMTEYIQNIQNNQNNQNNHNDQLTPLGSLCLSSGVPFHTFKALVDDLKSGTPIKIAMSTHNTTYKIASTCLSLIK